MVELMNRLVSALREDESGQGLVEYALILVLIAIVVIAALTFLGGEVSTVFSNIARSLNAANRADARAKRARRRPGSSGRRRPFRTVRRRKGGFCCIHAAA